MASLKHSQDRTFYVIRDVSGQNDAVITTSEDEAYDIWQVDAAWVVDAYNPIEGWSMPVTGHFEDRLEEERDDARGWQRHCDSYSFGGLRT